MRLTVLTRSLALIATLALTAGSAHAAFIVEARATAAAGKGFGNFGFGGDTTSASTSTASSAAVGTTPGIGSVFGGNGVNLGDTYVFSYTPGVNLDNTVYVPGTVLGSTTGFPGNGNVATGFVGGVPGLYNVYFTAPESTNVSAMSNFTLTQNGANITLSAVNLNNTGTGPDTDPGTAFVGGANNAWHLLGQVNLVTGTTYTVTQDATANTFVSQRASAVMWELAIPEPSTLLLGGMGLVGAIVAVRRRVA